MWIRPLLAVWSVLLLGVCLPAGVLRADSDLWQFGDLDGMPEELALGPEIAVSMESGWLPPQNSTAGWVQITQAGHSNQVYIAQVGGGNVVSHHQKGSNNSIHTNQTGAGNLAVSLQYGYGNHLVQSQYGNQLQVTVTQFGNSMNTQVNQTGF